MKADVFIATTGNGLARASRSTDDKWSVEFLLVDRDVRCLAADPLNRKVVYAGTKPALVFVSRDGGARWKELAAFRRVTVRRFLGWATYVKAIAPSPIDPNVVNVGIEGVATVRSADGGKTWTGHLRGALRDCHSLVPHPTDGDRAYEAGGTGGGAALSRDAGATWKQHRTGLDRHYGWAVAADPADPEVWYVSVSPGPWRAHGENDARAAIFRSTGGRWQRLAGGLPQPLTSMPYALLTEPEAPGRLYAGLANGEVWHSADHGESWQKLPLDLRAIDRELILL